MILALTLMLGAVTAAVFMPRILRRLMFSVRPVVALIAWIGTIGAVLVFSASSMAVLLWPNHAPAEVSLEAVTRCLTTVQHAARPWIREIVATVAVLVVLTVVGRVIVTARRHGRARSKIHDFHRDVIAIVARTESGAHQVMWLDHPLPMAYSIDGKPGYVVATEGLARCLTDNQRDAVIAHERAHLQSRHHRILSMCEVLATALPRVPLFAAAPAAVEALVELAADQSAAQATSRESMRSALQAVTDSVRPRPALSLGLFNDATGVRLRSLEKPVPDSSSRTRSACVAAALLPTLLPALVATSALGAAAAAACLVLA